MPSIVGNYPRQEIDDDADVVGALPSPGDPGLERRREDEEPGERRSFVSWSLRLNNRPRVSWALGTVFDLMISSPKLASPC